MGVSSIIYKDSTGIVEVDELTDKLGAYQSDATVTMESFTDELTDVAVSGVSVPLTMDFVAGSNGKYQGVITHSAVLTVGRWYVAEILAIAADGSRAVWKERTRCVTRQG